MFQLETPRLLLRPFVPEGLAAPIAHQHPHPLLGGQGREGGGVILPRGGGPEGGAPRRQRRQPHLVQGGPLPKGGQVLRPPDQHRPRRGPRGRLPGQGRPPQAAPLGSRPDHAGVYKHPRAQTIG